MLRQLRPYGMAAMGLLLAGCAGPISTLEPHGPRAAQIADTWWIMLGLALVVYVGVLGMLFYAVFRPRPEHGERGRIQSTPLIVGGGIVLPLLVLPIIWIVTLGTMERLATPTRPPELTVEVIGHQWWYEIRYPEHGVTTTNELRMPAGVPVRVQVGSADVIHSFWVPQLSGKLDMIPGQINEMWLEASRPGTYLGECGEFCGLLHARMHLIVVAEAPDSFAAWLAEQR